MNKQILVALIVTGISLGTLLTWQFNTRVPIESSFPSDEVEAKETLLKSLLDEQSYLQSRIVSLREETEEAQETVSLISRGSNLELLEAMKKDIGLNKVGGEGLEVTLNDSPLISRSDESISDSSLVQASDIRDVVNALQAGSAEAVSINGQRIIAGSTVSSVGTKILVNNSPITPPFVINAVGAQDVMMQRVLDKNMIPEIYAKSGHGGITFEVEKMVFISIPIYNGDFKLDYINLIEE
jgi:uncharacterized protein YlxW (UPF0749 family)